MNRRLRTLGLLVGLAAAVAFVAYAMRTLRGQDLAQFTRPMAMVGVAVATLLYAAIIPVSALAWRRLLSDLGFRRSWRELGIIMSTTQIAKYLPGNVGHHLGRGVVAVARGIPLGPFLVSVGAESVVAVLAAVGVGTAAACLSTSGSQLLHGESTAVVAAAAMLAAGLIVALLAGPRVVGLLLNHFKPEDAGRLPVTIFPGAPALAMAFLAYVANFALIGAGASAMAAMLLPDTPVDAMLLMGSFALAWVVGFFTPGAPAGLGVREGVMLALLTTAYTTADALLIIIGLRLATTAGDALCFLGGSVLALNEGRTAGRWSHAESSNGDHDA